MGGQLYGKGPRCVICSCGACGHLEVSLQTVFQLLAGGVVGEEGEARQATVPHGQLLVECTHKLTDGG